MKIENFTIMEGDGWNVFTTEECVVCMDAATDPIFVPCGHKCCCATCSANILQAEMPCPMCRQVIRDIRRYVIDQDIVAPIPEEELSRFEREEKSAYCKRLVSKKPSTSNALFAGKGRFQRSVSSFAGNERDKLAAENFGLSRVTCPRSKVTFEVIADTTLEVKFKVGRKAHTESYPYIDWNECQADLETCGKDAITTQYLAVHNPAYYWLVRYHNQDSKDLDAVLLAQVSKRQKL